VSRSGTLELLVRKLDTHLRLSADERRAILGLPSTVRTLQAGQELSRDGEQPSHCTLVLSGFLCRSRTLLEGKRQILSLHLPGDVPDLDGLHLKSDLSLAALTRSEVVLIPHPALHELCAKFPALAGALWRESLADAAILRERVVMGRRSARARVAHFLCELMARLQAAGLSDGRTGPMPLSQIELADATGLTNVHVNRTLQDLRGEKLIMLSGAKLTVLDWPGLAKVGEFDPTYLGLRRAPSSGPEERDAAPRWTVSHG
jgi:CRP-like cAMP-binding protein